MRTHCRYLGVETSWGAPGPLTQSCKSNRPCPFKHGKQVVFGLHSVTFSPSTQKEQTRKSCDGSARDEMTKKNTNGNNTAKPTSSLKNLKTRDARNSFLMTTVTANVSDGDKAFVAKLKAKKKLTNFGTTVNQMMAEFDNFPAPTKPQIKAQQNPVDPPEFSLDAYCAPSKDTRYESRSTRTDKHTRISDKHRKYLLKELRFKPDLHFKQFDPFMDKKSMKSLDKTIKGLAVEAVCDASFRFEGAMYCVDSCKFDAEIDPIYMDSLLDILVDLHLPEKQFRYEAIEDADFHCPEGLKHDFDRPADKLKPNQFFFEGEIINLNFDGYTDNGIVKYGAWVADYLESPLHFWTSIVLQLASTPSSSYPFVMNSILTRYAYLLRSKDVGLGQAFAILSATGASIGCAFLAGRQEAFENKCNHKFKQMFKDKSVHLSCNNCGFETSVDKVGPDCAFRVEAGESSFEGAFDLLSIISRFNKAMSTIATKAVIGDIVKALAVGTLAMTAYTSGKFSAFSVEGANALVAHALRRYTSDDSIYASFFRVASSITTIIYGWCSGNATGSFVDYVKEIGSLEDMTNLMKKLCVEETLWDTMDSMRRDAWVKEFHSLKIYAELHLGSNDNFKLAKRYLSNKQIEEWRAKYLVLHARFNSDIVSGMRRVPWAVSVSGVSSIGKSAFALYLASMIISLEKRPHAVRDRLIYTFADNGSDFWDGFTPDTLVIFFDDMCSRHSKLSETSGGDMMRKVFCEVVNNMPMLANKAALSQKENTAVRPTGVVVTTNVPTLNPGEIYRYSAIMDRRFAYKVHLEVKPEFATSNGTLCHFATAAEYKRRMMVNPEDKSPDNYWNVHVYESELYTSLVDGSENKIPEPDMKVNWKLLKVMDGPEWWEFAAKSYLAHHIHQHMVIDKTSREVVFPVPRPVAPTPIVPTVAVGGIQREGFEFDGKVVGTVVAAALGTYAAHRTYTYIKQKVKQVDKLVSDSQAIVDVVNSRMPDVQQLLVDGQNLADFGNYHMATVTGAENLINDIRVTNTTVVTKMQEACGYLRSMIACFSTISAFIGICTIAGASYKYFTKEDEQLIRQGNLTSSAKPPPIHVNDVRAARYEYPYFVGATNYLTQQSKAAQHRTVFDKANVATHSIEFVSGLPNETGKYSSMKTHGIFVKGKWLVFNQHCMPNVFGKGKRHWTDWTLMVHNCTTSGGDAVMHMEEVLLNAEYFHDNRDMVAIYVGKACQHKDITCYMPSIEGDFTKSVGLPPGLKVMMTKCGDRVVDNNHIGYTTRSNVLLRDRDDKNFVTFVHNDFPSKVGDCGCLYLSLKDDGNSHYAGTPQCIIGMHMGSMLSDPSDKLIVPWCKQDFDKLGDFPMGIYAEPYPKVGFSENEVEYHLSLDPSFVDPSIHKCPQLFVDPHLKDPVKDWIGKTAYKVNGTHFVYTGSGKYVGRRIRLASSRFKSKVKFSGLERILKRKKTPFGPFGSGKVIMDLKGQDVANAVAVAMSKAWSQPPENPQLREDAMMVAKAMLQSAIEDIEKRPDSHVLKSLHRVSPEVALNGFSLGEHPEWSDYGIWHKSDMLDNLGKEMKFKGLEAVNRSTSAGYPWNEQPSPNGLKGKMGYIIRVPGEKDRLHECIEEAVAELRELVAKGGQSVLIKAVIKDEPMKKEKIDDGRIRFILVLPLEATLLTREYLLTMCRTMALNPFFFNAMVGVDSSSVQWEQIHKYLSAGGAQIFDGDFKGFEYVLYAEITDAIKYYYEELCKLSGNYTDEELIFVRNLMTMLISCTVDYFGNVYKFRSINSSGNPLTTQFNCTGVCIWVGVVLINRMRQLLGEKFNFEIFYKVWKHLLRLATYGDDLLASIIRDKENGIELLNQIIMQEELAKFGVTFTDSAKSAVLTQPYPDKYMFLGRSFSHDHKGRMVAKLEEVRIMKPLEFTTEHEVLTYSQLLVSTIRSVLQETYYYGEETFDELFKLLVESVGELFKLDDEYVIKQYFSTTTGDVLNYDYFEEWFSNKYHKGAIKDVRYDEVLEQDDEVAKSIYSEIAAAMRAVGTLA